MIDTLEGYGAERSIVQIASKMEVVTPVFVHLYPGEKLKPLLTRKGIKVYSLNITKTYGYHEAVKKIVRIVHTEHPDLVHSTLFRADTVARKLKKKFPGIPLVGSLVSNSYGKNRYAELSLLSKFKLFTTQLRDRWSVKNVDHFVSNSKAIIKPNAKALAIPEDKIQVIYRGRNFEDYQASNSGVKEIRESLNLNHKKVFINVARLIRSKGQLILLDGFQQVLKEFPESMLLIVGEGPLRSELQLKIDSLNLNSSVFLLGYREDVPELLAASDFFIFPSYYEGLPGALIEAIIARKPVVVSDIPENRECFQQGGALFFTPGNVDSLAQKIRMAVEYKDWSMDLQRSYHFAEKEFQLKNISRKYEIFYKALLGDQKYRDTD
ncbi:MAG: glycosyltransferase [Christiangramia sp.]|nr:glycosyltransferase [Christiangramia sp.]